MPIYYFMETFYLYITCILIFSENPATRADSTPTSTYGRTMEMGPSILFAGQSAQWTGDSHSFKDQVGVEARVNLETLAGDRVTSYLTIINNGTTSIYYDWKVSTQCILTEKQLVRWFGVNRKQYIVAVHICFPFV